eukprot:TRINITY_DN2182_c0_g1_i4.p1 TRINITY_DN2182_c0_g1~~TRINITY_DN2182_c0_g1_i4.p1  ORF type:complete len:266 (+),score=118.01 TRINITY_DN2182_c0_g1_i4:58-855(+)
MATAFFRGLARFFRAAGQNLEAQGAEKLGLKTVRLPFNRHRPVLPVGKQVPRFGDNVFVAPTATIAGAVSVGSDSSVWYGAVLRGDTGPIKVGIRTNIQDKCVVYGGSGEAGTLRAMTYIGSFVTVGHGAVIKSSFIDDNALIGMNAVLEEGCIVENQAIVAAGAVLEAGTRVPSGELWAGSPAKFVRKLTGEELEGIFDSAETYVKNGEDHAAEFTGVSLLNLDESMEEMKRDAKVAELKDLHAKATAPIHPEQGERHQRADAV